jgi:hypothetical protein
MIKERPRRSIPRHAAVNLMQGDFLGNRGLGSLLICPPGSIVLESLEDLGETEVWGEAMHSRKDEVANQVDNALSFRLEHLPQPLRERADPPDDIRELDGDVSL